MATHENTKLCDFTSTNNSDFICTPIAPPAPAANFYEIKPALLNLVMKEQFSGASTDDATSKVFFLGSQFLPVVTGISGYREISKISVIYRPS
jgi:hypothetical protein